MATTRRKIRSRFWTQKTRRPRLALEALESRRLLATGVLPPTAHLITALGHAETLDVAQSVGTLDSLGEIQVEGSIGNGPAGAADVQWFQFSLSQASHVQLASLDK